MKRIILLALIGLMSATWASARGDGRLRYAADEIAARQVQAMLDGHRWAQVVRIENKRPNSTLPAEAWVTVFELGGRLWIYMPREGTRSLSVYRGRLARDKANLRAVLKHLEDGYAGHEVVVEDDRADAAMNLFAQTEVTNDDIPNSCFVRSVAWFERLQGMDAPVEDAHLLLYFGGSGAARWGHTVLIYETLKGLFVWDPNEPESARPVDVTRASDALALARRVSPGPVRSRVEMAQQFDLLPTAG